MGNTTPVTVDTPQNLEFLWIELLGRCNLKCTHCYAESSPSFDGMVLPTEKHAALLHEAYALGCRHVQFIGGEPTLYRNLGYLIEVASSIGYEYIELFSNLTRLSKELVDVMAKHDVSVAVSVYSYVPDVHDRIVGVRGSFARTVRNIKKLITRGISLRAAIVEMEENGGMSSDTVAFLAGLGVKNIGIQRARKFGRANPTGNEEMSELCGSCSGDTICISPDGKVSPCVMSKKWSVGSVRESTLADILASERLFSVRKEIYDATVGVRNEAGVNDICTPKTCNPYGSCGPQHGPGPCAPSGCFPCFPKG